MPLKEKEIEKLYYTIGEVSAMLQLNSSLLRYWEKEFEQIKPRKTSKGDRLFTKEDIEVIKLIHHLVKERGYTLDGAKAQLKGNYAAEERRHKLLQKLQKVRGFLVQLRDELQ